MKVNFLKISVLLAFVAIFSSCTDDDDTSVPSGTNVNPNDEELITTVQLIFSDTTGVLLDTFNYKDQDGPGGNPPVIDTVKLDSNTLRNVSIRFLDESDPNAVEDITTEVRAEDDEHFVCLEDLSSSSIQFEYRDSDGQFPIGLDSRWTILSAQNGTIRIILKHQTGGSKDGTCSPGDTDVDASFPFVIN